MFSRHLINFYEESRPLNIKMVTISEARARTEEAKAQIESQRQQLASSRARLFGAKPPLPTKQELFKPGLQRLAERKISEVRRQEIIRAEQQVSGIQQQFEQRVTQ